MGIPELGKPTVDIRFHPATLPGTKVKKGNLRRTFPGCRDSKLCFAHRGGRNNPFPLFRPLETKTPYLELRWFDAPSSGKQSK